MSLVNDILDYSKIEAGKFDLESINFDLSVTLDAAEDNHINQKVALKMLNKLGCKADAVATVKKH